jgi:hypothetical protein
MPSIQELPIGARFSFEIYPTALFGNNFRNVTLDGIISANMAVSYNFDVASFHARVYPTLPPGLVTDNPFSYGYVRFQYPSGEYAIMGIPWIRPESIQIDTGSKYVLVFNSRTQPDIDRIMTALSANGQTPDQVIGDS